MNHLMHGFYSRRFLLADAAQFCPYMRQVRYRAPPPKGKYDHRWQHAKNSMTRDPVYLDEQQRARAVEEIVRSFRKWGIELRILSIDRIHLHALARVIDHNPVHYMGLAKKEC